MNDLFTNLGAKVQILYYKIVQNLVKQVQK